MEQNAPMIQDWMEILGHFEFGYKRICINVNNSNQIDLISDLWQDKSTYVKGWAYYWNSIYSYIADLLEKNSNVRNATYLVKYDELCEKPSEIIDEILKHTELTLKDYKDVREFYVQNLHKPTYYSHNFTENDLQEINEITRETVARFE